MYTTLITAHFISLACLLPTRRVYCCILKQFLLICTTLKFHLHWDSFPLFWQCERICVWLRINPKIFVKLLFLSYPASSQNQNVFLFSLSSVGTCWTPRVSLLSALTGNGKGASKAQSHWTPRYVRRCYILPGWNRSEVGVEIRWNSKKSKPQSLSLKHPSHLFLKDEIFQVGFLSFEKLFVFSCSFWRPNQ